ncbi:regulatory protein RecX [Blastococcus tunisiensis]|uniref:Regulatory protein RecX n=1 Tax=Blastococcus tunisiensis TaxID=1798228 RepID=A0A1I2BUQ1_9ACTN|nr:regulatory protein RecX [Blastococcus sp. DSM 46838]SFE59876.1 regulatory protein [Blastococcus sp. DSM 46838]
MSGFPSTRRRGPGVRPGARRPGARVDDPLNPDVDPGPDEEMSDPESVARGICLRALTGAPKTRQQLADLLDQRGVPEDAAGAVLDRFTEVGLIDDAAFSRAWVTSRQAGRGLARRALSQELRAKGVDPDVAAEAVSAVDDEDERASARRLVERRATAMSRLDRATATRRLMGMLARKGYSGGMAAAVVREVLDDAGADEAADPDFDDLDEDTLLP